MMTPKEALRKLEVYSSTNGSGQCTQDEHEEAKKMAMTALEKLQHYEELKTAGRLVELSEGYTVADLAYCTAYESCPKDLGLPLPFNCNMQSCKDCWETALKGGGQNEID